VIDAVHRGLLVLFRLMPRRVRLAIVHTLAPGYSVGAMCIVERDDGARLFVRHSYRKRWGVPGGLLKAGEDVRDAARRETYEETGLRIDVIGEPTVVVEPRSRRVDVIFACRLSSGEDPRVARPRSAEIAECRWFPVDELPPLQHETAGALVTLSRAVHPGVGIARISGPDR
jgi:8-oxo-dGTP pyrophosphatase MutT (NUDIX family)